MVRAAVWERRADAVVAVGQLFPFWKQLTSTRWPNEGAPSSDCLSCRTL